MWEVYINNREPLLPDLADEREPVPAPHLRRDLRHQHQAAQRVFCQVRVVVARLKQQDQRSLYNLIQMSRHSKVALAR